MLSSPTLAMTWICTSSRVYNTSSACPRRVEEYQYNPSSASAFPFLHKTHALQSSSDPPSTENVEQILQPQRIDRVKTAKSRSLQPSCQRQLQSDMLTRVLPLSTLTAYDKLDPQVHARFIYQVLFQAYVCGESRLHVLGFYTAGCMVTSDKLAVGFWCRQGMSWPYLLLGYRGQIPTALSSLC